MAKIDIRATLIILTFLTLTLRGYPQIFDRAEPVDYSIIIGAIGLQTSMYFVKKRYDQKNHPPVNGKYPPAILGLDRIAIGNSSLSAHKKSDIILGTAATGYLTTPLIYGNKQSWYLSFETAAVTDISNMLIKILVKRNRPFTVNNSVKDDPDGRDCKGFDPRSYEARLSFYSGHTAHVAAFSYFTLSMLWFNFSEFRGNNKWAFILGGALPSITGYLRVRAGKHYPSDVVAGYLAGAFTGLLVPKIHKNDTFAESTSDLDKGFELALLGGASAGAILFLISRLVPKAAHDCGDPPDGSSLNRVRISLVPELGARNGLALRLLF